MALFFKACFYFSTHFFLLLTASGETSIYNRYIKTRVIECNVVSKLRRNRCITFGDLRLRINEHLHLYIYIYIYIYIYGTTVYNNYITIQLYNYVYGTTCYAITSASTICYLTTSADTSCYITTSADTNC
jgi:hypothetical protein